MKPSLSTDPLRIASLVPSLTELVCELGLAHRLVARTGFCIHPANGVRGVPKVGGTKDVNLAKLRALAPTHVLLNIDENRAETAEALREFVPQRVVTHPCGPADNLALVDQLARCFAGEPGVTARAASLRAALEDELAATASARFEPQRVLYLIWREPWMTVARDTYISRLLQGVGWQTLPAQDGGPTGAARYPVVDPGAPWLEQVQRVLLSSEPFRFEARHEREVQALCPRATLQHVDGERLSWYGPRAVAGLRYARELAQSAGGAAGHARIGAWT